MVKISQKIRDKLIEIKNILPDKDIFVVGGAIRDSLLGKDIEDVDIVILGLNVVQFFKKHKIGMFIVLHHKIDEVRLIFDHDFIDIGGEEKRIEDNLLKRDFTVNAMAVKLDDFLDFSFLDDQEKVIDVVGGMSDLKDKRLRKVTENSIKEDRLRILRALRFMLYYNLIPEKQIIDDIKSINFSGIAAERIRYELLKILSYPFSSRVVCLMGYTGIFSKLFPKSAPLFDDKDLIRHSLLTYITLERILRVENYLTKIPEIKEFIVNERWKIPILKLSALFHDIGKPYTRMEKDGEVHFYGHDTLGANMIKEMAEEIRFSSREINFLRSMIKRHMHLHLLATAPVLTDRAIRRFFRILGDIAVPIILLTYADGYATARRVEHIEQTVSRMIELKREDDRKLQRKRIITGYDLIEIGIPRGPIYKKILEEVEDMFLERKLKTKKECLEWVREKYLT